MDAINNLWNSILEFSARFITPDWSQLILLIPFLLLLLVILYLVYIYRAWTGYRRGLPRRLRYQPNKRTLLVMHVGGVLTGAAFCALAFFTGGSSADGTLGLTVTFWLLFIGLAIAIGTVGNAIRLWEDDGGDSDGPDPAIGWYQKHHRAISIAIQFGLGVIITAAGLLFVPPADPETGVQPAATLPILVVGLLLAISAVGRVIKGSWGGADPDVDEPLAIDAGTGAHGAH